MQPHVSLMQVIGELCRQEIMAAENTSAAKCIQQQRISPEGTKVIIGQGKLQSSTKVNWDMWWENSRNLCHSLSGWQKHCIMEPGKLHAQLQKRHAHMVKPVHIAGWVANATQ